MADYSIADIKKIYYREEDHETEGFAAEYDDTADFQHIPAHEISPDSDIEIFEWKNTTTGQELDAERAAGRVKGKLSFSKNFDGSLINEHETLTSVGYGEVVTPEGAELTISGAASDRANGETVIPVPSTANYAAGDWVQITHADGVKSSVYVVLSVQTDVSLTLIPMKASEKSKVASGDKLNPRKKVLPSRPVQGKSFQFVVEFFDGNIKVFRGCGISMSLETPKVGHGIFKVEVQSAACQSGEEETNELYVKPADNKISPEAKYRPVKFDFNQALLNDLVDNVKYKKAFPFMCNFVFGHSLVAITSSGGENNIIGYYTKPSIRVDLEYHFLPNLLKLFGNKLNEGADGQFFFVSQKEFGFYASYAKYINTNPGKKSESVDVIEVKGDVNIDPNAYPTMVLPA